MHHHTARRRRGAVLQLLLLEMSEVKVEALEVLSVMVRRPLAPGTPLARTHARTHGWQAAAVSVSCVSAAALTTLDDTGPAAAAVSRMHHLLLLCGPRGHLRTLVHLLGVGGGVQEDLIRDNNLNLELASIAPAVLLVSSLYLSMDAAWKGMLSAMARLRAMERKTMVRGPSWPARPPHARIDFVSIDWYLPTRRLFLS